MCNQIPSLTFEVEALKTHLHTREKMGVHGKVFKIRTVYCLGSHHNNIEGLTVHHS